VDEGARNRQLRTMTEGEMTTPRSDGGDPSDPTAEPVSFEKPAAEPVSFEKPAAEPVSFEQPAAEPVSFEKPAAEQPFDPYRFGAPEHPVPPEYAPPGYRPPPPTQPPAEMQQPQAYPGYAGGPYADQPYPGQPYSGQPYPGQPYSGQPYPGQPYPGQQYPYPPPYATQYPPPKTGNGKAIAGLVLGILAILFCWTSILDIVLVALGLIFGFLGIGEARRTGSGRRMAITGVVCALVGALAATLMTVWYFQRIQPCLDNYAQNSVAYNQCLHERF
jgi:hypothetical protein